MEEMIKKNYREELFGYMFYKELANDEKNPKVKEVLEELAEGEKKHSEFWKEVAEKRNVIIGELGWFSSLKLKIMKFLRRVLGLPIVLKIAEMGEINDSEKYKELSKAEGFSDTEKQRLSSIMMEELAHEDILISAQINIDNVRNAIYAVSDGLIEVLAGVSGLAGIFNIPLYVGLGGLIVGISGTISMSIGAYLSSSSESDIEKSSRKKMKELGSEVKQTIENKPKESVTTTAIFYILGALIPVMPFLLGAGGLTGLVIAYVITGIATLIVGSMIGILSDVNPFKKGIQMTSLAISAAIATHLLGIAFHIIEIILLI
ncbi:MULTISPECIES: VIT1/CCC1 family protein [Acidianus]|uniref:Rubrerythrin diiron-binding domain-containing protein n=1 Tax=Candidatus Acidianus copahuensis TaxID=1160895 RepID=A0A031LMV0_9CREN|nr:MULTISPECIES: VIT1/CCC1 family protein [Acidianus]EZQ04801.1 hypothetical protein CM19_07390 [Candidatus Acidianus copahuensis]NON61204.1 ferritin, CCC1 [Acidianus sp. RZ1]